VDYGDCYCNLSGMSAARAQLSSLPDFVSPNGDLSALASELSLTLVFSVTVIQ